jgi:hypothetical protein
MAAIHSHEAAIAITKRLCPDISRNGIGNSSPVQKNERNDAQKKMFTNESSVSDLLLNELCNPFTRIITDEYNATATNIEIAEGFMDNALITSLCHTQKPSFVVYVQFTRLNIQGIPINMTDTRFFFHGLFVLLILLFSLNLILPPRTFAAARAWAVEGAVGGSRSVCTFTATPYYRYVAILSRPLVTAAFYASSHQRL